ncbi:ABC transporter permease [Spirosoma arcticum]
MIQHIVTKERAELAGESRFRWAGGVLYVLFAVALLTGYSYYSQTNTEHETAQRTSYTQWLNQDPKSPHAAAHYGLYAYKPVPLMAILDKGMDDYLGSAVWLEAHNQNDVKLRTIQDSATLSRFGSLTVGFVLQFLMPLLLILLSYDAVSKERESGTLRILLSTNASAGQLLVGKWLAVLQVVLLYIFGPILLLSVGVMILAGGATAFADALPNLTGWILFYGLYYAFWAGLGIIVSSQVKQSGLALVGLLGFWAFGAFLVPRLCGSVARLVAPTLSALAFTEQIITDKETGINGGPSAQDYGKLVEKQTLAKYGVDSLSQLPVSFAGIALQANENRDWTIYDRNYGGLFRQFQRQEQVMEWFNLLSPTLAMRNLSRALAGTDMDKHIDFTDKAEAHRRVIQKAMNDDQTVNGAKLNQGYKASSALWQRVNQFQYGQPGIGFMLGNQLISVVTLLIWSMLAGLLLVRASRTLQLD